jgi:hypothetical protein
VIKKKTEQFLKYGKFNVRNTARVGSETRSDNGNNRGATGTVSYSFRIYLNNISGKHDIKELQTTAISGTAHVLRRVELSGKSTKRLSWEITLHVL